MGSVIVLMGPTGAGKSVQGDMLAKEYGGVHLSSGMILRGDPKTAELLVSGKLAPAPEVERVVGEAIGRIPVEQVVVLDGFPRTMSNVRWLETNLPDLGRKVDRVILIDLDFETAMQRLGLRQRHDDAPGAVQEKWNEFESQTKEVLDHYRALGTLETVDGRGTVEEVHEQMKTVRV